ncbi:hypothetical protein PG993_013009 [Apiospora rasikravindrae]|uniref:Uncharacterized protein n=1 Tax=Apiospora rasikravindrae TaxID=990691 RepID=A0ABR1RWF1_9PEZI
MQCRKALIHVTLSASPTLSRSDPDATLKLTLTLSLAPNSPGVEVGRPLTFATHHSICDVTEPGYERGIDIFARGGFGFLRSTSGDKAKNISLGLFRTNDRFRSQSDDLRERGLEFVTIPAATVPHSQAVATVTHTLNWDRIFQRADASQRHTRESLVPGEEFEIGINKGYMGTVWWCWGDLETDLRDKRFHVWQESNFGIDNSDERPGEEFVEQGNWVLGEDPLLLEWVNTTQGENQKVRIRIVE